MKTILVPTDFSTAASNAVEYAVEIAKLSKAKLVLFHAYIVPVIPAETTLVITADEMERNAMKGLKKIAKEIHQESGKEITIDCVCRNGFAVDEINGYAEENKVDLIVMGMEGTGYIMEKIIGSTTTTVIKKSKFPVLAIDKTVRYRSIKKIALACDYSEMKNSSAVNLLKRFTTLFHSKLYIVNVINELQPVAEVGKDIAAMKLEQLLANFEHSSYHIENEDVIEGINRFVEEKSIDMVVMIPHKHTALKNFFSEPHTKRMAFHTKVPLLTLHE